MLSLILCCWGHSIVPPTSESVYGDWQLDRKIRQMIFARDRMTVFVQFALSVERGWHAAAYQRGYIYAQKVIRYFFLFSPCLAERCNCTAKSRFVMGCRLSVVCNASVLWQNNCKWYYYSVFTAKQPRVSTVSMVSFKTTFEGNRCPQWGAQPMLGCRLRS